MTRHVDGNHALDVAHSIGAVPSASKRELIYAALRAQLESEHKRPWSLSQKLNDAPYRYTRDSFHACLNSLSNRLAAGQPRLTFGVEDDFKHPTVKSFAEFVNKQVRASVSDLINEIVKASRL